MHTITEEQRARLGKLDKKKRQKEILKSEYLNGEWYANDVRAVRAADIPIADCWTFGAPCQDFSIAGRRAGLDGERSSLVREIFRILEKTEEEYKPEWLIYENVKGMLSANRGLDFLSILAEMDRLGYDAEWQIVNSRWYVPQNRERVYVIGHNRRRRKSTIFPITGNGGENSTKQLIGGAQAHRVYDSNGIAFTQNAQAGGVGAKTGLYAFGIDKSSNKPQELQVANCLMTKDCGVSKRRSEDTAIAIPVLTPARAEKRQNGRRYKEAGEEMFTLTAQDQHGVAIDIKALSSKTRGQPFRYGYAATLDHNCAQAVIAPKAVWSEKYNCYLAIRKLTPKECFRLQGWTDDYFERAEFVNSNSQLYKQAGNGVTVNVVKAIGEKL
jgi:DNA (cytosine-5)-methyltransferase 1